MGLLSSILPTVYKYCEVGGGQSHQKMEGRTSPVTRSENNERTLEIEEQVNCLLFFFHLTKTLRGYDTRPIRAHLKSPFHPTHLFHFQWKELVVWTDLIGKPHDKGALLFFFVRGDVPSIVRCIESARTVFSNVFFFIFGRELRDR